MRIPKRLLVSPADNRFYATAAVALSTLVFAYSGLFGQVSILAFYALWFPLLLIDPPRIVGRASDLVLPAAFAALALASTAWSDAPGTSLRGGIQLATHIVCALIAARVVNIASLLWGLLVGCFLVGLYSLAFGRQAYDAFDGTYTFVGAFGSKNQLALYCSLGIYAALAVALTLRASRLALSAALAMALVLTALLLASRSATAILSIVAVLAFLPALLVLLRFSPFARNALLLLLVPAVAFALVGAANFGAADMILAAFGKDSTLTGRTYLWEVGLEAASQRPLLGVGFQAYWVQGFSEAERLWEEFYIASRTGFHFHNTYIEVLVELGRVGLALFVFQALAILLRLVGRIVLLRDTEAAVLLGLFLLLLIRSMSEVDALYQYTIGTFLLAFLYVSARRRPLAAALAPSRRVFGLPLPARSAAARP